MSRAGRKDSQLAERMDFRSVGSMGYQPAGHTDLFAHSQIDCYDRRIAKRCISTASRPPLRE